MTSADKNLIVDTTHSPDATTVTVVGEIDAANCDQLQAALAAAPISAPEVPVHVDLGGITFIDSSGLRALISGQAAITDAGGSMRVTALSDNVRRLFEITGLAELML
jgi:anti-anti-sigma factor